MIVEFWLREPGEHRKVDTMELDCVPRAGEAVTLQSVTRDVHSVTYIIGLSGGAVARVLLEM
jgi:hypothetical protein